MRILFAFCTLIVFISAGSAFAQDYTVNQNRDSLFHCGTPESNKTMTVDGSEHGFCDMYSRRFEYRERRGELRAMLDERRENYARYGHESRKAYKEQLNALHNSINE